VTSPKFTASSKSHSAKRESLGHVRSSAPVHAAGNFKFPPLIYIYIHNTHSHSINVVPTGSNTKRQLTELHGASGKLSRSGISDPLEAARASASAIRTSPQKKKIDCAAPPSRNAEEMSVMSGGEQEDDDGGGAPSPVRKSPLPLVERKRPLEGGTFRKTPKRRKKSYWAQEQEELLIKAVEAHGKGSWRAIIDAYPIFSSEWGRTQVDLKDKWRNLEKGGKVPLDPIEGDD
jgi:hypothetical protein